MQSSFQVTDDILVVSISGELDHHHAAKLREDIDEALSAFHCKYLVMDLEKVTFMDSSGIGVVLGRYNKLLQKGGRLMLTGCSEYVEKILFMAGVFTVIEKEDTAEAAVWRFRGQQQMQLEVSE